MTHQRFNALSSTLCLALLGGAPHAATDPIESNRLTLELVDTDIRDALRLVARQGDINLVMSNDIEGSISLELDDVSVRETLDAIASVGGFQYTIEDGIVTVATLKELLERNRQREEYQSSTLQAPVEHEVLVLSLRYVDAERMKSVLEELLSETGTVSLLKTADHIAKDSTGTAATGAASAVADQGLQIGSQLNTSTQGRPAKSHTLVVVDEPARLEKVQEVASAIDVKPMQVVIEARFVEVTLDNAHKLGIDWNLLASASGSSAPHTFPFGNGTLGPYSPNVTGGTGGGIFPDVPDSVSIPGTAGLFTFGTLDFSGLSAILEMIRTDARVEVVSNPRIVVSDRHTATILVGERYPILSANVSEFGSVTEQLDRYEPIGVQLEVTPSVIGDDEVELFVRPSSSSLGPLVAGSTGISVARINSRQIDTSVSVRDQETVVLGGLFTTRESTDTTRVPFLSRIPILGRLFRHEASSVERVDLVIFLTVALVRENRLSDEQRAMFEDSSPTSGAFAETDTHRTALEYAFSAPQY